MSMDLTGITNKNEYYTNHYFSTVFEENTRATISGWNAAARESEEIKTPWSLLRQNARQYYTAHDKFVRSSVNLQVLANIKALVGNYLKSLGYPEAKPEVVAVDDSLSVPVYLEMTKSNGAPLLWVLLSASKESDAGIMESFVFNANDVDDDAAGTLYKGVLGEIANEDLVTKILFGTAEPPRFVMLIGMNQIALIDRNKWNEKRYLQFELEEIFSRLENTTLQAMSVLLHKDSLCPDDGKVLLDELDEQSQKNASGVSQDLKYALRESIELLGNEVLYDMKARLGRDLDADPVDAGQLTLECLRYMYRMLFVLFIESRPELGYAPIKAQSYYSGYSLESLRDIADNIRDDVNEVGDGYYLHETLAKLYELIYDGYPKTEDELKKATGSDSLHDMFLIAPLKAHIFDPEYTKMITAAKLRNSCMLRIIDLMSLTRATGRKNGRRGRISYVNLGINQMGAVYEALLSYRGFIAEHDLYEVKRAGDSFNELDVGYFVSESELEQYTEDERVRYESGEKAGKLRMYEKGTFIYRLAGREREKSASYYTPEVLTKCLVKHALKELLEGKTADEILKLTICEPAMGSAAFLNEAINQLAEAYISRKEKETGEIISYEKRFNELQKVKMFIADRNVYGIDLNPVAVELAEVSLWLNTIYEGGFVPWFGTQLVNGNSLIGARRQVYRIENAQSTSKGLRWYEMEPDRVPLGTKRMPKKQVYHFLLGDPGMCSYTDKVIKQLEPANIKEMKDWNKKFTSPFTDDEVVTLLRLSAVIDELWEAQIQLRKEVGSKTQDALSTFYEEEWNRIVIAQEALTLEKYVKATRNGRGTRLDRKKRMQVWKVFENYQNLMKENQIRDINTAMYESTKLLQSAGRKPRYASIIIDEGQDFSDNAYRLIRALAGEEHPNDIFIVGDSHQRIYRNYPTLSKCGINVRGRSSILKINYRTTEEIRKHAFALLNGISFDDLDEDLDLGDKCQSLTHGEKPIVENFENANDEFDFLLREVKKLKENGVSLTDICVVARTKKLVDDYIALFTRAGIRSYAIKRNKVDDRSFDGLRVATMHRVKGLEFKYVFIAAVNNRIIPLPFAINKTDAVSEVESITSEKCLLYVAMTRAQKGVYITSYGRPSEFLV